MYIHIHTQAGQLGGVGSEVIEIGGLTVRVGKRVAEGGFAFVHVARYEFATGVCVRVCVIERVKEGERESE